MTTQEIANDFVALCRQGKLAEAGEQYWAADIVSVEAAAPGGGDPVSRGIDAVRGKGEWWANNHEVHGVETNVVPRSRILPARIPQADDELHRAASTTRRPCRSCPS